MLFEEKSCSTICTYKYCFYNLTISVWFFFLSILTFIPFYSCFYFFLSFIYCILSYRLFQLILFSYSFFYSLIFLISLFFLSLRTCSHSLLPFTKNLFSSFFHYELALLSIINNIHPNTTQISLNFFSDILNLAPVTLDVLKISDLANYWPLTGFEVSLPIPLWLCRPTSGNTTLCVHEV